MGLFVSFLLAFLSLSEKFQFFFVNIKNFGISGIGYAYPDLHMDVTLRIALGLAIATVVFFADLYFIVKGMDDLGEKPIKVYKYVVLFTISG